MNQNIASLVAKQLSESRAVETANQKEERLQSLLEVF